MMLRTRPLMPLALAGPPMSPMVASSLEDAFRRHDGVAQLAFRRRARPDYHALEARARFDDGALAHDDVGPDARAGFDDGAGGDAHRLDDFAVDGAVDAGEGAGRMLQARATAK